MTGRVFAGDGVTAVPGAPVYATDVASGAVMGSGFTDATGAYTIPALNQGPQGFQFQAVAPRRADITAQATDSFSSTVTTLTENFTLPLGVVRGSVFLADGVTPATGLEIRGGQAGSLGNVSTQFAFPIDNQYEMFFVPGAASVRAIESDRGAAASRDLDVTDVTQVRRVDLVMPPNGFVTGTVRNDAGDPVPYASVVLSSVVAGQFADVYGSADADGIYSMDRVPVGGFSVEACDYSGDLNCHADTGTLDTAGTTAVLDVALPAQGDVEGTALLADGSPLPSYWDLVQVVGGNQGAQFAEYDAFPRSSDTYWTTGVPVGPVVATFSSTGEAGLATGTLTAAGTLTLDVTGGAGGAVPVFTGLTPGADGFNYRPECSGVLQGDEGGSSSPYDRSYVLRVGGVPVGCLAAARAPNGPREMIYGPYPVGHVLATRRVYVPDGGGFARFLETFENATGQTQTLEVSIESTWSGVTAFDVPLSATGGTWAVTTDGTGGASGRPVVGHVLAGPGAGVVPSSVDYQAFLGGSVVRYRLTIPAGAAVTLMHFTAQRAAADTAGARAQAQALVTLSDPNALAFMTPADKARVVNFVVP